MDSVTAKNFAESLKGQSIGGWVAGDLLGAGKSAVVMKAQKEGRVGALKVFEPELIEKFGREKQLGRINRERALIGEKHTNLIEILDGGECTSSAHLFIVMKALPDKNMMELLSDIPRESIGLLIRQVAAAAKFLETMELCHRDIKPENIAVNSDFSQATLLDLGVVRPFGNSDLTDDDAKQFIGTLRYSSPEFLIRDESQTADGYRALTFYQLGAVLYDMLMKQPIFCDFSDPYAVLTKAVESKVPVISAKDADPDLTILANNCLVKDPQARLRLVSWDSFECLGKSPNGALGARRRVELRNLQRQLSAVDAALPSLDRDLTKQIVDRIESTVRLECTSSDAFPRMRVVSEIEPSQSVRIVFDRSQQHSLQLPLSVRLRIELVDSQTLSVIINASATFIQDTDDSHPDVSQSMIFRGPLDDADAVLQEVLYTAMDQAQVHLPTDESHGGFDLAVDTSNSGEIDE